MKKIILFIVLALTFVACTKGHYETVIQQGIVVDVEYHPAFTSMRAVPIRVGKTTSFRMQPVHHSESWNAHVHYCDTICVHEKFYEPVKQGDTVQRTIQVFIKDKEK